MKRLAYTFWSQILKQLKEKQSKIKTTVALHLAELDGFSYIRYCYDIFALMIHFLVD